MTAIEKSEYEVMDALDEQQIVSELKGHVIEQYFYEFPQGGRQVVGISWAGIKYIARKLSDQGHGISIEDLKINEKADYYEVIAVSMDVNTKEKRYGAAQQAKTMLLKDNTIKDDPFALQKAISKAQRNAIRNFIPEVAIQEGFKEWKNPNKQDAIEKAFGKERIANADKVRP